MRKCTERGTGGRGRNSRRLAFTLAEMLVVISIIGILAGLLLSALPGVYRKRDKARAEAFVNQIDTAIQHFYSAFNTYPAANPTNTFLNGLYYELTGVWIDSTGFTNNSPSDPGTLLDSRNLTNLFRVDGFLNATNPPKMPRSFLPNLKPSDTMVYQTNNFRSGTPLGLKLFNPGVRATPNNSQIFAYLNYDNVTTNRHNPASYDLWVTWTNSANRQEIVGNWKN